MKDLSKIKLIISDFDQTLTSNINHIDDQTVKSIHKWIEHGFVFGIATGRSLPLFKNRIKDFKLDGHIFPLITYQGAVTASSNGDIKRIQTIPFHEAIKIIEYLEEKDLYFHISSASELVASSKLKKIDFFQRVENFLDIANFQDSVSQYLKNLADFNIVQISILVPPYEDTDALKEELNEVFKGSAHFVKSHPQIIETTEISTSKGHAVVQLAKDLGLENNEVMVIGDSLNDLSMFETKFVKVAVDNAEQILKEKADYISSSCSDLGVSKMIEIILKEKGFNN